MVTWVLVSIIFRQEVLFVSRRRKTWLRDDVNIEGDQRGRVLISLAESPPDVPTCGRGDKEDFQRLSNFVDGGTMSCSGEGR